MKTELTVNAATADTENRIGPYIVQERLGEGGMAVINKVWHTGLHRFEALKLPRQKFSETSDPDPAFIHRLLSEARLAAQLYHPHIVTIYNISEEGAPQAFFTMEFVDGYDLGRLLEQRGRISLEDVIPIIHQVASALDYAHANGVVHRDVKPSNILLKEVSPPAEEQEQRCTEWHVKVVDFGISRALEDGDGTKLTKSGMIVGTPEYMSPEQAGSGGKIDYRMDIYSLGVVVYEMLCGRPPFTSGEGVSPISVLVKQLHDSPRPPIEHLPNLPLAANDAVLKALAKDPEERFVSCAEFVAALSAALTSCATAPLATDPFSGALIEGVVPVKPARSHGTRLISEARGTLLKPEIIRTETARLAKKDEVGNDTADTFSAKRRTMSTRPSTWLAGVGGILAGIWILHSLSNQSAGQNEMGLIPSATSSNSLGVKTVGMGNSVEGSSNGAANRRWVQQRQLRAIPFARRVTPTAALMNGQRRISQKGQTGQREVILGISYDGQRELARRVLSSRVVKAPVPQVEQVGVWKTSVASRKPAKAPARKVASYKSAAPRNRHSSVTRPVRVVRAAPPYRTPQRNRGERDLVESVVGDWLSNVGSRGHGGKRGKHKLNEWFR